MKFDKLDVLAITFILAGIIGITAIIVTNTKNKEICHIKGGSFIDSQCLKIQTIEI